MLRVVLALGLVACSAPSSPPVIKQESPRAPPALVVRMERTECLSNCPTYVVELWSDGRVVWNGRESVAVVGRAEGVIALGDLDRIIAAFDAGGFFRMDKQPKFYDDCTTGHCVTIICNAMDQPSTIVAITRGTATHSVELVRCGKPDPLDDAIQLVDRLAHTRTWVGH